MGPVSRVPAAGVGDGEGAARHLVRGRSSGQTAADRSAMTSAKAIRQPQPVGGADHRHDRPLEVEVDRDAGGGRGCARRGRPRHPCVHDREVGERRNGGRAMKGSQVSPPPPSAWRPAGSRRRRPRRVWAAVASEAVMRSAMVRRIGGEHHVVDVGVGRQAACALGDGGEDVVTGDPPAPARAGQRWQVEVVLGGGRRTTGGGRRRGPPTARATVVVVAAGDARLRRPAAAPTARPVVGASAFGWRATCAGRTGHAVRAVEADVRQRDADGHGLALADQDRRQHPLAGAGTSASTLSVGSEQRVVSSPTARPAPPSARPSRCPR